MQTLFKIFLSLTLVSPGAYAAPKRVTTKQVVGELAKETKIGSRKSITFGELFKKMSPMMTSAERAQWNKFLYPLKDQRMTRATHRGNKLFFNVKGKSITIEFFDYATKDETFVKINGIKMSRRQLGNDGGRSIIAKAIGGKDGKKLKTLWQIRGKWIPPHLQAKLPKKLHKKYVVTYYKYLAALEKAERVAAKRKSASNHSPSLFVNLIKILLGDQASAIEAGQSCIDAGWIGKYRNGKKGLTCDYKLSDLYNSDERPTDRCKTGQTPCNYVVFDNATLCVDSNRNYATSVCTEGAIKDNTEYIEKIRKNYSKEQLAEYEINNKDQLRADMEKNAQRIKKQNEAVLEHYSVCQSITAEEDATQFADVNSACKSLFLLSESLSEVENEIADFVVRHEGLWDEAGPLEEVEVTATPEPPLTDLPLVEDSNEPAGEPIVAGSEEAEEEGWWDRHGDKVAIGLFAGVMGFIAYKAFFDDDKKRKRRAATVPRSDWVPPSPVGDIVTPPITVARVDQVEAPANASGDGRRGTHITN